MTCSPAGTSWRPGARCPTQLYVIELGVGNGGQARTWLDEFVELDRRHGRDYYRRLHYLMGDYSAHVLDRARQAGGAPRGPRVGAGARGDPAVGLGRVPGGQGVPRLHLQRLRQPAERRGRRHPRPDLPGADPGLPGRRRPRTRSPPGSGSGEPRSPQLTERLLRIGPELLAESQPDKFPDTGQAVLFWQAVWEALRQAERYVPLEGLDTYRITPAVTGEILRPLLAAEGDVRMHVSNGALSSFADTLPLLHPFGRLVCHDLFTTSPGEYRGRLLRPWQVRRVRRQLGQRPAAAAAGQPARLRRAVLAVQAAPGVQRQDADRPGQRLKADDPQRWRAASRRFPRPWSAPTACPSGSNASRPSTTSGGSAPRTSPRSTRWRSRPRQGPGAGGHRHRLRRRAAPGQRHRLLPRADPRRAHRAAGQVGLLRLLRRGGHRAAARRTTRSSPPAGRPPRAPPARRACRDSASRPTSSSPAR